MAERATYAGGPGASPGRCAAACGRSTSTVCGCWPRRRCLAAGSIGSCCPGWPQSTGRGRGRAAPGGERAAGHGGGPAVPVPACVDPGGRARRAAASGAGRSSPRARCSPFERAHPGLPGSWCELAGELAEAAGDPDRASGCSLESARRTLARGCAVHRRADRRARPAAGPGRVGGGRGRRGGAGARPSRRPANPRAARAIGQRLLGRFAGCRAVRAPHRSAARYWPGPLWPPAIQRGGRRRGAEPAPICWTRRRVGASVGRGGRPHRVGPGHRVDDARRLAMAAADRAGPGGVPEVECEALEVLGRSGRRAADGSRGFERAAEVAERHGLTTWRLRALHELAITTFAAGGSQR